MDAVFRCRHLTADSIAWTVNGSSATQLGPNIRTDIINENGIQVYILIIPIRREYNGTEIVCVALFIDGSLPDESPLAILTIIAGLIGIVLSINPC